MGVLFWFLLKSIISSLIGQAFYKWFKTTTWGIWFDKKLASLMDKVTHKESQAQLKKDVKILANDNENGSDK